MLNASLKGEISLAYEGILFRGEIPGNSGIMEQTDP